MSTSFSPPRYEQSLAGSVAQSPPPRYELNDPYYLTLLPDAAKPKEPSPSHHDNVYAEIDSDTKRLETSGTGKHASRQSRIVCCFIITVFVIILLCGVSGGGVALFYHKAGQNQQDGAWSPWSTWGECVCAEDCQQFRSRQCIVNGNYGDAAECHGNNAEVRECDIETCAEQPCQEEMTSETSTVALPTRTKPDQPSDPQPTASAPERHPCRADGSCFGVVGGHQVHATCEDGYCVCNSPDYNRDSCLPSVGTCQISHQSTSPAAAHASYLGNELETYKCVTNEPGDQSIHVLAVYEGNSHTRPPSAGDMNVVIKADSSGNKPLVLVLSSYEPVRWVLDVPDSVPLDEILLISYYIVESSIGWASTARSDIPITRSRLIPRGYGSDSGGGNTVGLLKYLRDNYGPVNSFTGTYKADHWTLDIRYGDHIPGKEEVIPTTPTVISNDTWTLYSFAYDTNWNDCNGLQYVRSTGLGVGAYVGVVLCSSTRYKIFLSDDFSATFRNVADLDGSGQDHCELVGAPEDDPPTLDTDFWESPSIVGYYRAEWGEKFKIGNIGEYLGRYYVKWYECGVSIP